MDRSLTARNTGPEGLEEVSGSKCESWDSHLYLGKGPGPFAGALCLDLGEGCSQSSLQCSVVTTRHAALLCS